MKRRLVLLATALTAVVLTGCGTGRSDGTAMMGGNSTAPSNGGGMGNTGGWSYHFSNLTCLAPRSLPGHTVNATLADMGMTQMTGGTAPMGAHMMLRAAPDTVAAGQITLIASNKGWRTHELVVLPLPAGATAGQRIPGPDGKVSEAGSLGEASHSCGTGTGAGIIAGTVSWTTLTLTPGRYELICNQPNHYADGMYQQFTVT